MPLYEYECFLCGHRFERLQRVTADPVSECPECGGAVRRLLGVPALQFKGSGFYITDYGKGNGNGATREKAENKEKTGAKNESTTPASTSDASSTSSSGDRAK
jgi:putative FmdB family regulatory protein